MDNRQRSSLEISGDELDIPPFPVPVPVPEGPARRLLKYGAMPTDHRCVSSVVRRLGLLALVALFAAVVPASASAQVNRVGVGTFANPISLLSPPGDTERLFVVERAGRVRISQGGATLPTPFLDVSAGVSSDGEGGLLSLAFPPDYATSGRFYVYFTPIGDTIRIAEGRRDPADPNRALSTLRRVIDVPHPTNLNHYGGQLQFDRSGSLFVFTGDGGGGGDPARNARNLNSTLGKILRIDPRGAGDGDYSIPPTIPSPARPAAGVRSGPMACAIPSAQASTESRAT